MAMVLTHSQLPRVLSHTNNGHTPIRVKNLMDGLEIIYGLSNFKRNCESCYLWKTVISLFALAETKFYLTQIHKQVSALPLQLETLQAYSCSDTVFSDELEHLEPTN
ncbi:unnamed protein product [Lathyrus sativus]|nr:unnamed protein product [Lathyrus sativus]